jgi:hypothetical protein
LGRYLTPVFLVGRTTDNRVVEGAGIKAPHPTGKKNIVEIDRRDVIVRAALDRDTRYFYHVIEMRNLEKLMAFLFVFS